MNVCYPVTVQHDYTELRFSLRSIEKFLTFDKIIIVGDVIPDWLTGITQIHLPDIKGQNNYSVRRKVIAALHYADEFLYMNDDIYLLQPVDKNFPYYSSGVLDNKGESGAKPLVKRLKELGKPTKYYGHYPTFYRKDFIEIMNNFPNECITKSAYLNFIGVDSIEVPDCKVLTAKKPGIIQEFIRDRPCFSTGIYSIGSALPILENLFPDKSNFEI